MSMQDPIADLLTRVRNGHAAGKKLVKIPYSKVKEAIVRVLEDEGYISSFTVEEQSKSHKTLAVELKYYEGKPVIARLDRVSKPGLRIYRGSESLPNVLGHLRLGTAIISTSSGVMSDRKARELGQGGEVLCIVE